MKNAIRLIVYVIIASTLITVTEKAIMAINPGLEFRTIWIFLYLVYIIGAIYHYKKDSDGIKITTFFIIIPLAIVFYGAYLYKENPNIASLIMSATCITFGFLFWHYTTKINRSDTLKEAQKREDERKKRKQGEENGIRKS
jgi:hypothetical protein